MPWRRFFGGKPSPDQAHPETILYNYLTTPRVHVPRWYHEGSAVFMHVAKPDYEPTAGCVALAMPDLLALLKHCSPGDRLCVAG